MFRKRVGKAKFPTVVRMFVEALAGKYGHTRYEHEDFAIFAKAMGGAFGPDAHSPEDLLALVSRELNVATVQAALESTSDADLAMVRNEAGAAHRWLTTDTNPYVDPALFLCWFVFRKAWKPSAEMIELILSHPSWPTQRQKLLEALKQLRDELDAGGPAA